MPDTSHLSRSEGHMVATVEAAAAELGMQTALAWDAAGVAHVVAERADKKRATGRGLRGDARRQAEYIASRGRTPLEMLHDLTRGTPGARIKQLAKGQCSDWQAVQLWVRVCEILLPYSAAMLNRVEVTGDAGAAGGFAAAHFLAASAMSQMLHGGGASPMLSDTASANMPQTIEMSAQSGSLPSDIPSPAASLTLPPKGAD